ncbi:hypothetical protein KC973_02070 [Candidatus Saccharibacteria bacterium]|nr:hypothetical protein [Candidatus Saccharibacteria bacterium]
MTNDPMTLDHDGVHYSVGKLRKQTTDYRLYLCTEVATGRLCLLQIPSDVSGNGNLDRAQFILGLLKDAAAEYEELYLADGGSTPLSYDRLFPQVVDSFVVAEQDARRVNILAFTDVETDQLFPLSNVERARQRVDLRSSAWVLGRLLKLLAFTHEQGITINDLDARNVLLWADQHFALVLNWASARTYLGEIPATDVQADISQVARTIFTAIGGDADTGVYEYDAGDEDRQYIEFIQSLMSRSTSPGNAYAAHHQLYELINVLWGREFRPFKTLPR